MEAQRQGAPPGTSPSFGLGTAAAGEAGEGAGRAAAAVPGSSQQTPQSTSTVWFLFVPFFPLPQMTYNQ